MVSCTELSSSDQCKLSELLLPGPAVVFGEGKVLREIFPKKYLICVCIGFYDDAVHFREISVRQR